MWGYKTCIQCMFAIRCSGITCDTWQPCHTFKLSCWNLHVKNLQAPLDRAVTHAVHPNCNSRANLDRACIYLFTLLGFSLVAIELCVRTATAVPTPRVRAGASRPSREHDQAAAHACLDKPKSACTAIDMSKIRSSDSFTSIHLDSVAQITLTILCSKHRDMK